MKIENFNSMQKIVEDLIGYSLRYSTQLEELSNNGISTDLNDVTVSDDGSLMTTLEDGTKRNIIVHISELAFGKRIDIKADLPKYHIYECSTYSGMKNGNRANRYKKTTNDDGKFYLIDEASNKGFRELRLCSNCWKIYNNKNYPEKFSLKNFMNKKTSTVFNFKHKDSMLSKVPKYSSNWKEISVKKREESGWKCQKCSIDLRNNRKFLQTHHKDGDKTNNNSCNLIPLCIECHSNEFMHAHMKKSDIYLEFKNKVRKGVI